MDDAEMDQSNLLENIEELINKFKPRMKEGKVIKRDTFDSLNARYEGHELTYFEGFKILTPKQMPQRLSIALPQVKAGKTFENLLNKIRKNILFFVSRKRNF